ncbi:MAG: serine/threonine-protein kinase [Polyangiaceae bacterium]
MIGQVLDDKYEVARLIGEGGMGAVYEAREKGTDNRCAVKVINDDAVGRDEVLVKRFEREAFAAQKIVSPHIVEILDAGHDPETGHPYMVMEMLDGENALELLTRVGPLPAAVACRIGIQVLEGLAEAHAHRVVHRDIKPANLFIADKGDELVVKLLDFGVAKFKMEQAADTGNQSLTRTGSMLGSPMYMSPEQARGLKTIDHRADLWSLGIVLYQLLVGAVPFEDIDGLGELIITICSEPPPPVNVRAPWVPQAVADVIAGALKLASADRFESAEAMAAALQACIEGDARITKEMIVPLDRSAASPPGEAVAHGETVSLDGAPVGAATVALSPEELEAAAAVDRGDEPEVDAGVEERLAKMGPAATIPIEDLNLDLGAPPEAVEPAVDSRQRRRDEDVLKKHREAQRAALDAARLVSGDEPAEGKNRSLMVVALVAIVAALAWLGYSQLRGADGGAGATGGAPEGTP